MLVGEEDVGIPRHTKWTQVGSTPFQAQVELCTLFHPSLQVASPPTPLCLFFLWILSLSFFE